MSIDQLGSLQAVSPHPGHGPWLDRRQLVQGVVAASLAGAAGGVDAGMAARFAGATGLAGARLGTAADQFSSGDLARGACLEATLHVMMA
jgi:hypothetical protein